MAQSVIDYKLIFIFPYGDSLHLLRFTNYSFSVRAKTIAGTGPWSPLLLLATSEDIPDAPSSLQAFAIKYVDAPPQIAFFVHVNAQ